MNEFFANLLCRHMSEAAAGRVAWTEMDSAEAFVYRAFVTPRPFEELVHASASVPRDIIQMLNMKPGELSEWVAADESPIVPIVTPI